MKNVWTIFLVVAVLDVFIAPGHCSFPSNAQFKYFGDNTWGASGRSNKSPAHSIDENRLPIDGPNVRSIACSSSTTAVLYRNQTLNVFGLLDGQIHDIGAERIASPNYAVFWTSANSTKMYGAGQNDHKQLLDSPTVSFTLTNYLELPKRLGEDYRLCTAFTCLCFNKSDTLGPNGRLLWKYVGFFGFANPGLGGMGTPAEIDATWPYNLEDLYVSKASMGYAHSIFLLGNGTVVTSGGSFVIGRTSTPHYHFRPIQFNATVANIEDIVITDISTSSDMSLMLSKDHRVFFFGTNFYYASGDPTLPKANYSFLVSEIDFSAVLEPGDKIRYISTAQRLQSAISEQGRIYVWGTYESLAGDVTIILQPTLYSSFFSEDEFVVGFIGNDDISRTSHNQPGSCVWTIPRTSNCTGPPPSPAFACIGGIWTPRDETVEVPSLIVTSPTIVDGSIIVNSTVTFEPDSFISTLNCFEALEIEIILEDGNPSSIPSKDLISTNSSCKDISGTLIKVSGQNGKDQCKKTSANLERRESGGKAIYSAIFKVDSSGCKNNLWWILVASIGGGVVLIILVVILLVSFVEPIKLKVRPFWIRSAEQQAEK